MNQQAEGFKNQENDFKTTMNEIENELLSLQSENSENKNTRKKILDSIFDKIRFCETKIKLMNTEMVGLHISELRLKGLLQDKLDRYRNNLKELTEKCKIYKKKVEPLMGIDIEYGENNDRLLKTTKVLSDGVENLKQAKKTAYETDELGIEINRNLHNQTTQLNNNITKMRDADSELGFANKLLNEMNRRRITNKLILCGVATVCLIGTGFVLYYSLDD